MDRIPFDPEAMLDKAIKLWLRSDRPFPSHVESDVDLGTQEINLRNVNGLLATYRILAGGRLRRKAVQP